MEGVSKSCHCIRTVLSPGPHDPPRVLVCRLCAASPMPTSPVRYTEPSKFTQKYPDPFLQGWLTGLGLVRFPPTKLSSRSRHKEVPRLRHLGCLSPRQQPARLQFLSPLRPAPALIQRIRPRSPKSHPHCRFALLRFPGRRNPVCSYPQPYLGCDCPLHRAISVRPCRTDKYWHDMLTLVRG